MRERAGTLLQVSLLRFVRRGAWGNARKLLAKSHPADIALVLDRLTDADRHAVFALLSDDTRAEVLGFLEFADRPSLLIALEPDAAAHIVERLETDDAAEILRELPREQADRVLELLGPDAAEIESLLGYAEDTAGAIMSPEYFALDEMTNVREAIERLQHSPHAEAIYVYVIDERRQLVGVLSLRQLITQKPNTLLRDAMIVDPIRVTTEMDQEEVAKLVARYDLLALPVVDPTNKLVGLVTVDDVIDVIREEATEDILKMAGTTVEEITSPGAIRGAWIRFPWLAASFTGGLCAALLLNKFEDFLRESVQLIFFLPVILGMGGNVASQCAMVMVRGIATGRLEVASLPRLLAHECGTGLLLAIAFALALAGAAIALGYGATDLPLIASVGIFVSVMIAAVVGTLFPIAFRWMGFDPAIASGPLVTTSADVLGIASFFGVAYALR